MIMKIFRLAAANLKRKKGLTVTLLLLSVLAALFLNMGLIMSDQINDIFNLCAQRLKSPEMLVIVEGSKNKASYEAFLRNDGRVDFLEKEEVIYLETSKNSANTSKSGAVIFNKDLPRRIEPVSLLEEDTSVPAEEAIYLPMVMKGSGVSLGDPFTLTLENVDYTFRAAGFFETSYMGAGGYAFMKYYLPESSFQKLYEAVGTGTVISVRLKEGLPQKETSSKLSADFSKATDFYTEIGGIMAAAGCLSYEDLEMSVVSLLGVPMIAMISIAFIICMIHLIIVYFKVREEIDESLTNIGCLQAFGYTTGQIMCAKTLEFVMAGGAGTVAGVLLTYVVLPFAAVGLEGMVGLKVSFTNHFGQDIVTIALILLLLWASAMSAAWKIRRITPVTALRRGVTTHHYGRNYFPLDRGRGGLELRLALKNICMDLRQNLVTVISIGLSVFAISMAVVLYLNMGYDHTALEQTTGIELADVQIKPLAETDALQLEEELGKMEEVRKTNRSAAYIARIGEINMQLTVCSDFEKTEYLNVSKGSLPKYSDEIVLTSSFLKRLDKGIGDTVRVTAKGITADYLIVGAGMGTNMNGRMGLMSEEGLHRIDPYYKLTGIDIYLREGVSRSDFMDRLRATYSVVSDTGERPADGEAPSKYNEAGKRAEEKIKRMLDRYGVSSVEYTVMQKGEVILTGSSAAYRIREISSLNEYLDGQLKSYAAMMNGLMAVILSVMLLVMGTIISITVSSMLRRKRMEMGIYRSMGFTTEELIRMIGLNFTVDAVLGSLIGILLCGLFGGKLLILFFSTLAVDLAGVEINPVWLGAVGVITVLFVCLLSVFKARRVRRISVYELLTE